MPRSILAPFLRVETSGEGIYGQHLLLPASRGASTSRIYFGFHVIGTTANLDLSRGEQVRLLCHALIQRLDERGLGEAVESLVDMVRFFDAPPSVQRTLPTGPASPVKVGPAVVRPVCPVAEDD